MASVVTVRSRRMVVDSPSSFDYPRCNAQVLPGDPEHAVELRCHPFRKKNSGWLQTAWNGGKHFYKFEVSLPQALFLGRHRLELRQPATDAKTLRRIERGSALSFFSNPTRTPRASAAAPAALSARGSNALEIGRRGSNGSDGGGAAGEAKGGNDDNDDDNEYEDVQTPRWPDGRGSHAGSTLGGRRSAGGVVWTDPPLAAGAGGSDSEGDAEAGASTEKDAMLARCAYFEVTSLIFMDPEFEKRKLQAVEERLDQVRRVSLLLCISACVLRRVV